MNTTKFLRLFFAANILTPILVAIIFESGFVELHSLLGSDALVTYCMQMVGIVLTIGIIPFALKMMKLSFVKRRIQLSEQEYLRWSIIRIAILGVPLIYNTLAYYLLEFEPTCGYLALIVLVAFCFVWPSDGRMRQERELIYDQEEA